MMLAKVIKQGLLRGGITLLFMGSAWYFSSKSGNKQETQSIMAATIISVAVAAASTIYDYDIWSVKKKLLIHTVCMFVTVYPALIISGWFDTSTVWGYLHALLAFILTGAILATVCYLVSKYIFKNVPTDTNNDRLL